MGGKHWVVLPVLPMQGQGGSQCFALSVNMFVNAAGCVLFMACMLTWLVVACPAMRALLFMTRPKYTKRPVAGLTLVLRRSNVQAVEQLRCKCRGSCQSSAAAS